MLNETENLLKTIENALEVSSIHLYSVHMFSSPSSMFTNVRNEIACFIYANEL